jgi:hypothetical protein
VQKALYGRIEKKKQGILSDERSVTCFYEKRKRNPGMGRVKSG